VKVLLQRVTRAAVRVDGATVGEIGCGILALVGVESGDADKDADYFADKTAQLRIFRDDEGRMNRSVEEVGGEVLVVSQFTLAAATPRGRRPAYPRAAAPRRGRRPSYSRAAAPEEANRLYERYRDQLAARGLRVACGTFQAMMEIDSINDGPVTILLDPPPFRDES
jgi:D-tyrosyl-tRNA(Tyr) deacylase